MSTNFGFIPSRSNAGISNQGEGLVDRVYMTRFFGGDVDGVCLQITVGDRYVQLDEAGVLGVIEILSDYKDREEKDDD